VVAKQQQVQQQQQQAARQLQQTVTCSVTANPLHSLQPGMLMLMQLQQMLLQASRQAVLLWRLSWLTQQGRQMRMQLLRMVTWAMKG
jgi:hypothetical protein